MKKKTKRIIWISAALCVLLIASVFVASWFSQRGDYQKYVNHTRVSSTLNQPLGVLDLTNHQHLPNLDLGYAKFYIPKGSKKGKMTNPDGAKRDILQYENDMTIFFPRIPSMPPQVPLGKPITQPTMSQKIQRLIDALIPVNNGNLNLPQTPLDPSTISIESNYEFFLETYQSKPLPLNEIKNMDDQAYTRHVTMLDNKASVFQRYQNISRFETDHIQGFIQWFNEERALRNTIVEVFDKSTGLWQHFMFHRFAKPQEVLDFLGSLQYTIPANPTSDQLEKLRSDSQFGRLPLGRF